MMVKVPDTGHWVDVFLVKETQRQDSLIFLWTSSSSPDGEHHTASEPFEAQGDAIGPMLSCGRPHLGRWTWSSGMAGVWGGEQVHFARRWNSSRRRSRPRRTNKVSEKETPLHGGGGDCEPSREIHRGVGETVWCGTPQAESYTWCQWWELYPWGVRWEGQASFPICHGNTPLP